MKILWSSNSPFSTTGYGVQTRLFTPHIKNLGHDVRIQAWFGHENYTTEINWGGIPITGRRFDPYGRDALPPLAARTQPDIILTLVDAWIYDPALFRDFRWVPWFPVDSEPIPPMVTEAVRYAFERIVFSKFAQKQLEDQGLSCLYVPHGVDTKTFAFAPTDASRKYIGLPQDAYVVGMVAANKGYPSRKAFEQNMAGFKLFSDKHPDALLFMQTWAGENGRWGQDCVNLLEYAHQIGLQPGKNLLFCDQFIATTQGFPDAYMVALYNSMDVLLSVSRGEGFGIPILEAQACGTPVIVGDWTAMSELCFSGWKVKKDEAVRDPYWQKTWQYLPSVEAIADRLEMSYQMRGNEDYRKRARQGAEQYDVAKVTEKFWKPALEAIAARIEKVEALKKMVSPSNLQVKEISA